MKSAVIYFPYPPFPIQSGGQWRCVSVLLALIDCGYEVTLISDGNITQSARISANSYGFKSWISAPSLTWSERVLSKIKRRILRLKPSIPSKNKKLIKLLQKVGHQQGPFDLVMINYANNKWVRQFLKGKRYILDTLDLISVSEKMILLAESHVTLNGRKIINYDSEFLNLEFFKNIKIEPIPEETEECCGYDLVMMIAEKEDAALIASAPDLKTAILPPSGTVVKRTGDYEGLPVFASGPNIFNTQGLLGFQEKILPAILREAPKFRMNITGKSVYDIDLHSGLGYLGVVPDIYEIYQRSGFAIVPTFGGTGQQLKVVEAMGAGLAVVAYAQRIDAGIIDDGIDGFLATNEAEFAKKTLMLWNDVALRRQMGTAAREKMIRCYSQEVTNRRIRELLLLL